jgi:hypothetical protein
MRLAGRIGILLGPLLGLLFVIALDHVWTTDVTDRFWTRSYVSVSRLLLFVTVGWVAYKALASTRLSAAVLGSAGITEPFSCCGQ